MVLKARVHSAELQDRAAVPLVLEGTAQEFPRLEHLWVDQGYTGTGKAWIEEHLGWSVEVVKHPPKARGQWQAHGDLTMTSEVSGLSGSNSLQSPSAIVAPCQGAG
jgi:putative transposase